MKGYYIRNAIADSGLLCYSVVQEHFYFFERVVKLFYTVEEAIEHLECLSLIHKVTTFNIKF